MNRQRQLIERCLNGTLTQDEWTELSSFIGAESITRIQQGDMQLRERLMYISIEDALPMGSRITIDTIKQRAPSDKGLARFLRRWGLLMGLVFFVAVLVAILPFLGQLVSVGSSSLSLLTQLGPMQLGIGAVLLVSLGVAAWMEFSDRF